MNQRPKPADRQQATTHPETKKRVRPGVADDQSSKSAGSGDDARSGQDKDGNEQHPKARRARG
jgi:hypothetical protein